MMNWRIKMNLRKVVPIIGASVLGIASFAIVGANAGGATSAKGTSSRNEGPKVAAVSGNACSGTPVSGGSLVYARGTETVTLNPLDQLNGNGDIFADNLIYQGLLGFNPKGKNQVIPDIAQSWTQSSNGLLYTFKLRPGVKFSNGQPVTAQDVAWSLNNFGNPKLNIIMSALATGYGTATVVNSSTVQIKLVHPVAAFLDDIATFPAFILPESLVKKEGVTAFFKKPVGSGPFEVQSFVSGSHLTFVKNPYYWDKPLPYLNKVTFNFALDSNSRLLDLQSGEAQIADLIEPSQFTTIKNDKNLVLATHQFPDNIGLYPNEKFKPFSNVDVRLAMADAINRKMIINEIFHGVGTVPNSFIPHLQYDGSNKQVPPYQYNVTEAKKLMKEAGYAKGFNVTLQYPTGFDYFGQMTLLLKQELAVIGINVTLEPLATATMTNDWLQTNFQLTFAASNESSDVPVPDEFATFWADPGKDGLDGFFTGWKDPAIWTSLQKFESATTSAARVEQWPKLQEAFMKQMPAISLVDYPIISAHAKNVCGADVNIMGVDELQDTWIAPSK
jgi:peptide/nickel transport system substrate-binding protein